MNHLLRYCCWFFLVFISCQEAVESLDSNDSTAYIQVLGVAQDAGYPQANCQKACCERAWGQPHNQRDVACLVIVDPASNQYWLIEATPDFRNQLRQLQETLPETMPRLPAGIFLTHAHIGHYSGLIHLGREVMGTDGVPVYAMPRMAQFLSESGPWSQLVELGNIDIQPIEADSSIQLSRNIAITPLRVPHRDEFSETVGFRIESPERAVLFIPDIDKWEKWDKSIESQIKSVNVAYLDGTFFQNGEIPGRDMAEIPHPFVEESMHRFRTLPEGKRKYIRFIHFNHTNPLLDPESEAYRQVIQAGYGIAEQGERVFL